MGPGEAFLLGAGGGCLMARIGRPPKPTALRETGPRSHHKKKNRREPKPAKAIPPCPRELSKVAKREWRRVSKQLYDLGLLTHIDRAALAAYCQGWAMWLDATAA